MINILCKEIRQVPTGFIVFARWPIGPEVLDYGEVLCKTFDEVIEVLRRCSAKVHMSKPKPELPSHVEKKDEPDAPCPILTDPSHVCSSGGYQRLGGLCFEHKIASLEEERDEALAGIKRLQAQLDTGYV